MVVANGRREVVAVFDGTFDGFLCVVYAYYYCKITPIVIQRQDQVQLTLDSELYQVDTDQDQAGQVLKGLHQKVSEEAAHYVYHAFLSGEEDKYMTIFSYILRGFTLGHMVDSHLQEDCVRGVHKLAKHVGREAHLLTGFCRFAETDNGVYYCAITPKNDVLAILANHFSQRFMNQAWVIHDKSRNQAAIYDGDAFVITKVPRNATVTYAEGEKETQELWTAFFKALAIEARKNSKLQRQLLPLYFRKNMTEFNQLGPEYEQTLK
ncbi:MAG: TIGR03915 family putative DNA repair protein [Defluviitaleaceae bacterium]|nr:TIGR03915 family putative DNA repair protein [Defluviitaleaceae bacterium]